MANGTSTIVVLHGMVRENGRLTSINPFQHAMCNGKSLDAVRRSGYSERHTFLDEPDYFALPRLLETGGQIRLCFY